MLAVNGHAKHRQSLCRVGYGKTALSMDLLLYSSQGRADPAPTVGLYFSFLVLSCTFVAQKYQTARHPEKAVRRLFAYKPHATFFGRAAFGIAASPSVAGCCGINFFNR